MRDRGHLLFVIATFISLEDTESLVTNIAYSMCESSTCSKWCTTNLSYGTTSSREGRRLFPRARNDFRAEEQSYADFALFSMFGVREREDALSGLEWLQVGQLDVCGTEGLRLFNLVPIKYFQAAVGTDTGWLLYPR